MARVGYTIIDDVQQHLAKNRHATGIFTLSENMNLGETIGELLLIGSASLAEEYRKLILYFPIN